MASNSDPLDPTSSGRGQLIAIIGALVLVFGVLRTYDFRPRVRNVPSNEAYPEESFRPLNGEEKRRLIDAKDALVYFPSGISKGERRPIVIAFSPTANAPLMIRFWRAIAEKQKWIVYASKEYSNNQDVNTLHPLVHEHIVNALRRYRADENHVILTGLSGGGSFSHLLNFHYPGLAAALIVNSSQIFHQVLPPANRRIDFKLSAKLIVFLASDTDPRYETIKKDRVFLEKYGWDAKWIDFKGGHVYAPMAIYEEAVRWIVNHPQWGGSSGHIGERF